MIGPTNFIDEIDCGSFFDHIDDLLDFPTDDIDSCLPDCTNAVNVNGNVNSFPSIWSTQSDSLPGSHSVFSSNTNNNSASDLSAELSVPYEDIVQLEWLSNFVEDSFSGGSLTMNKEESTSINKDSSHHHQFQTSSPVSVLESSSSCSGEKTVPRSPEIIASGRRGRARSKRPRPATFTPRPAMQLISPSSSATETPHQPFVVPKAPSDSENYAESRLLIKLPNKQVVPEHKKKKKIKFTVPLGSAETSHDSSPPPQQQAVRKCMHCEITKTPQWRAGPMGPKTLCNACGVRYKSGRLFPEYRPAASPTFVPSLHSNSHKKVLEMRNKVGDKLVMPGATTIMTNSPEFIPNNSNLAMDYM
ncbi:GATA transcription factor 8 [Ricinus communis]|uniref:GATA transcription factor n=1 Tax=Ricinus communis TaxID=3988 RepID=B9T724_RICCO|nr:GATA transcription factor 8 [Ricinus communis]XP_048231982.1 GATA transcription factor 8 [Ricinus communis]EEF28339.1 GATA transcription factor, putative [Ricinus communis]|eukprot:XP_002534043.1 GATA transcription factor 8 [Ricinus communis]